MYMSRNVKLFSVIALFAMLALPSFAFGTNNLTITGTMPLIENISFTGTMPALDLENGVTGVTLLTVIEKCNRAGGFTVTLSSQNAGALAKSGAPDTVGYTLSYDGGGYFTPASGIGTEITTINAKTTKAGSSKLLKITIPAPSAFLDDGSYTDYLTFTITAK
jgi:hypothetical protein